MAETLNQAYGFTGDDGMVQVDYEALEAVTSAKFVVEVRKILNLGKFYFHRFDITDSEGYITVDCITRLGTTAVNDEYYHFTFVKEDQRYYMMRMPVYHIRNILAKGWIDYGYKIKYPKGYV